MAKTREIRNRPACGAKAATSEPSSYYPPQPIDTRTSARISYAPAPGRCPCGWKPCGSRSTLNVAVIDRATDGGNQNKRHRQVEPDIYCCAGRLSGVLPAALNGDDPAGLRGDVAAAVGGDAAA